MLNNISLQGRLVADPDVRQTNTGTIYAKFTVAWSDKYKDKETQCFLNCTSWGGTAEFIEKYFSKGKEIVVEGKLQTDKWTDKDGSNRSAISCMVSKVHFCGGKGSSSQNNAPADGAEIEPLDDMPF